MSDTTRYVVEFRVPNVITGMDGIKAEDSGMTLVLYNWAQEPLKEERGDGCLHVRLISNDTTHEHPLMKSLMGKTVRVTVEELGS